MFGEMTLGKLIGFIGLVSLQISLNGSNIGFAILCIEFPLGNCGSDFDELGVI